METTVRATCPQCQTVLKIPSQWLGQAIKCKKCGTVVRTKARGDGATETARLDQTQPQQNGNGVDHGAFDFAAGSPDDGDGSLEFTSPASDSSPDGGFDPTGGADISSQQQQQAAPQPAPPSYPYPVPPGYPQPGAVPPGYPQPGSAYGAPPGYPYAPPPGYPYAPPPGYPPGAPPGYGPPPGAYGAPPAGYPYTPPPGYPPAPASGVYGAAPGYPYPMPPGTTGPGAPPAPGMPGGMPGMPPASGVYYGAGGGAYPPAPGAPATPPAPRFSAPPSPGAPAAPPAPKFPAPPAPGAPPAPASGVMSGRNGTGPAKPGMPPAKPGAPAPVQPANRPAAQPAPNSAFKTDVPATSARTRKGNDKSKMIWVAVCLVLTGGLVTAAIMVAKSINSANIAKKLPDDPYKLVEHHMTSLDSVERDAAIKALRDMGDRAEPALKEGAKSSNPDVAKKCQELLASIKTDPKSNAGHAKTGPFPRRLLFIHISKYMYLNPLTAGQAGGEDRTKGAAIRLANEWSVPFDPKDNERNQLFFMSDTARPDNLKTNDVQTPMKNVVEGTYTQFFATSRGQDRIVVYFGGHALEKDGKAYLAPIEGDLDDPEPSLIPLSDFYDKMKMCKATQRVVIWDVCRYNPQRGRQRPGSEPMSESLYKSLAAAPPGVEVIITCQPGENALEFFNVQIESGATATAPKYAGSAFLESMKYVASKNSKLVTKQAVPTDPIPIVEWSTQVGKRVTDMATSPVVNLKQGLKLEGKAPANWVAFNPEEPIAKRFEFPLPPKGTNPAEVAAIVNEFNVPSIKLDLIDSGLGALPFREEVMKDYKSDVTIDMVLKNKETYKFQAKTFDAIDKIRKMWTVTSGASGGPQMRDDFKAPVNDALKNEIKKEQDFWAIGVAELDLINAELDGLAADRESQPKRWQAHYDYARATIKARLAFMNEYNKLMGNVLTETLPALDAKLGQDTYKLTSTEKMKSSKEVQALAKEAKEAYEKLVTDHKGTPWAIQAKRDKSFAIGLAWVPISSGAGTAP